MLGSFAGTRIFGFASSEDDSEEDDSIEEVSMPHFDLASSTVFAGNLGRIPVQVTSEGVRYRQDGGSVWRPADKRKITEAVKTGKNGLVLALENGQLVVLELQDEDLSVVRYGTLRPRLSFSAFDSERKQDDGYAE